MSNVFELHGVTKKREQIKRDDDDSSDDLDEKDAEKHSWQAIIQTDTEKERENNSDGKKSRAHKKER